MSFLRLRFLFAALALLLTASRLPAETLKDIPYTDSSNPHQTLDLYLPANRPAPLFVWIHGGGWKSGDKHWVLVSYLEAKGYAIASLNYRFSNEAIFPAQIQDCNAALNFLVKNAARYGLDPTRIVVGGDSAGGHLSLLLGLARTVPDFQADPKIQPRAVIDFFGPTDFTAFNQPAPSGAEGMIGQLLGASPVQRPDLAKTASPLTYVTTASPPVLILQGDKDNLVPPAQSTVLAASLKDANTKSELLMIPGAGHEGPPFSTPEVQQKVLQFLESNLPAQP